MNRRLQFLAVASYARECAYDYDKGAKTASSDRHKSMLLDWKAHEIRRARFYLARAKEERSNHVSVY